ncbi:hypothetical protein KR093_011836, partial [Drosophila rubida]
TFVTCYATACEMQNLFRCGYGGCINETRTCDGKIDCLDGSDENKFLCADDSNIDAIYKDLRGDCSEKYGLSCKIKSGNICLKWSQICDGIIDCVDASDEKSELCSSSLCPEESLHCENGACINKEDFCNHKTDCADGSDEIPEICSPRVNVDRNQAGKVPPTYKDSALSNDEIDPYNGLPPEQSVWQPNGCRLASMVGMHITDYFTDFSYIPNTEVPLRTVVAVNCEDGYENFNTGINRCIDNKWATDFSCMRVCDQSPMIRNPRYATVCIQFDTLGDCKVDTFIQDTELQVTCAPGYQASKNANQMGKHICSSNGTWLQKDANPNCEAICGIRSAHHPTITPWTVSIFERDYYQSDTYVFRCSGTILSPHVILTASSCFGDQAALNDSHIFYSVVVGEHNISYNQFEDHGYDVRYLSDITIAT